MCGISINLVSERDILNNSLTHRGPDNYDIFVDNCVKMQFYRLKINDLSNAGNQPMQIGNCVLICNGEIFNHESLINMFSFQTQSKSDCEVIIHLYLHFKNIYNNREKTIMDTVCNLLDGEFVFCLYDIELQKIFYARDPYGVRPMFFNDKTYSAASELKAFDSKYHESVHQFKPGHFAIVKNDEQSQLHRFTPPQLYTEIFIHEPHQQYINDLPFTDESYNDILVNVKRLLTRAVTKRLMSERNVCALLSGGLDSSLIAALVSKKLQYPLKTFSIGFKESPDLFYANKVAEHIKSEHTSIELEPSDFLNAIETVIQTIESYDTTSVRASVGNYLVSKYISDNTDCVVVFNGDYADEVCGGYKYVKNCTNEVEFQKDCINRVRDICYYDSLRSDRSISNHGLEARVPFADKLFVQYYMTIPPKYRMSNMQLEKKIIREAFANDNLLPDDILWRPKEAFSDGVSQANNSWGDIVKQFVDSQVSDEEFESHNYMKFKLKETYFYHKIFSKYYKNDNIIPYLWMPRFCDGTIDDPSARKL